MGRVIEVVSGQTFDGFLKQRIFEPTGMNSTFFRVPESELGRLTTNYGVLDGNLVTIDLPAQSVFADPPPFPMGGSGLVSSARDYDRFLRMLLGYGKIDGTRVMSELAVRVGTSNLLPEGVDLSTALGGVTAFGAGGRVGTGETAGTYGWGGAAGTAAFADFKRGLRATMMTQYMSLTPYPLTDEFNNAIRADLVALADHGEVHRVAR
jgi:CubicO group peptidase (beta-lactamase class C family)